ncbi:probable LRR receptor-like serine/threonine-protein kinase At3g47570 isoform X2 [Arachis duranensis]|uniref:non-specific serine/threonine protein kinase n=1 Tax=Arachis duranensis TaxID=130453 RepID=A0A9C6T8M1_ARADU|nr:probable LRR receptor-like serine/threonine-protein kinase At3g47570 isoform X2 [Arachis duranensis]
MSSNNLYGRIPMEIGTLKKLEKLSLNKNNYSGEIPSSIWNISSLSILSMGYNYLEGKIPEEIGKLKSLSGFAIGANKLSGELPSSLYNLSSLAIFFAAENQFHGSLPSDMFSNLISLQEIGIGGNQISGNNFSGAIPVEVFSLSSLSTNLNLSHNSLNGTLPVEVGALGNLGTLDISNNSLSGQIPMTIGKCTRMEYLDLHGNSFSGMIPSSIASLKGLSHLDLSRNNLSGSIPTDMQRLSFLTYLNVSFNMLEGKVPLEGVFKDATAISIVGNNKLCGGVLQLHLAPCPANVMARSNHHNLKLGIIVICVVVCLILLSIVVFLSKKKKRTSSLTASTNQLSMVSYQILHHSTQGFSTSNLIGSGSFGSVYKGFLESEHKFVAIKVINLQMSGAHKSFIAECNALKFIRHRNLVKILTCCSSIDYSGQEFKALVFEYMPNGSLEKWLHPSAEITDRLYTLDLTQRLNIVVDVASALHYLHYGCEQPVVHCDLKPENVLLDDDMVAHVTDFGLARLLSVTNGDPHNQSSTTVFKGTIGYAPPEYGMSCEVSMQGDVYSFGILVLEMVTGRRPMEEMFKDDNNLHNYVKMAYSHNLLEIMDSTLLPKQTGKEEKYTKKLTMCVFSLIRIGLACSVESPNERMNMADVTRELNLTKDVFLQD